MEVFITLLLIFLQSSPVFSQADDLGPRHSVRCDGPLPDFGLPILEGWDPSQSSLQEICAMQAYGGNDPLNQGQQSRNLQFYCEGPVNTMDVDTPRRTPQSVIAYGGLDSVLRNPRLLLYCRERCYCDRWNDPTGEPLTIKPFGPLPGTFIENVEYRSVHRWPLYEIQVEARDDYINPHRVAHQVITSPMYTVTEIFTLRTQPIGVRYPITTYQSGPQYVTINQLNKIQCGRGPLPDYLRPPSPYGNVQEIFSTILEFCATALAGGNAGANAGGYCHNTQLPNGASNRQIWFSDDMTPRLEWTWTGNMNWAGRARSFCSTNCWCLGGPRPRQRRGASVWKVSDNIQISYIHDGKGSISIDRKTTDGHILQPIRNPFGDTGHIVMSTSCAMNGLDTCKGWPVDILGPKPITPPLPKSLRETRMSTKQSLTCGAECNDSGAKSCAGFGEVSTCQCVVLDGAMKQFLGLSFDSPSLSRCLSTMALTFFMLQTQSHNRGLLMAEDPGSIGAQDENRGFPAWDARIQCRCNATFIDASCCVTD